MVNMNIAYKESVKNIDWVALSYPEKWYVVEVKYSNGGDIAITECRTERGKEPKTKDNSFGFTLNFKTYEEARKFARYLATELKIKAVF